MGPKKICNAREDPMKNNSETASNYVRSIISPSKLELILYPTEQCNFRCTYCYEDFLLPKMPDTVIDGVEALLSERAPDLSHLNLLWFGGEPLAAKEIVLRISRHAFELAKKYKFALTGSLTTNAYLLDLNLAHDLATYQQRNYQITLDGDLAEHNRTRILASGGGTFSRIIDNIWAIHESELDVSILLRIHLTPTNLESVRTLLKRVLPKLGKDNRFKFFFKPIENWGGPNATEIVSLSGALRDNVLTEFNRVVREQSSHREEPGIDVPKVCYASRPNSLAIRADGTIQKCTVALNEALNTVGQLSPDGKLNLNSDNLRVWLRGLESNDFDALHCPARNIGKAKRKVIEITPIR